MNSVNQKVTTSVKPKRRLKKVIVTVSLGILSFPAFFALANVRVLLTGKGKIYEDFAALPHHRVGIVLGCAPNSGAYRNSFFVGRINTAVQLYKAHKVDRLLVSGDNGSIGYDEPTAMEEALIAKGVPAEHIKKDFAGFHTLDTMVRANKIFGLTEATIITDDFHMARSIYLAEGSGIKADGFPSKAGQNPTTRSVELREIIARGGAVIDQDILHTSPKFLGKQESIP